MSTERPPEEKLYVVMRAVSWSCIEINGHPLPITPNGPQRFIPVFDTQEQAMAWAVDGDRVAPIISVSEGQ